MACPLLVLAPRRCVLARRRPLYRLAAAAQGALYGLAVAAGLAARGRPCAAARLLAPSPAYFCLVNLASLHAAGNLVRRRPVDRWQPRRRGS